ncbi:MAG: DNA cytosine methyltransferase [Calothrix sp. MO_192.B10]|nr:DNA cytosine methyltransferase [Calothrix sp. MO_192.B10]
MLTHADFFAGIGVFSLAARELLIDTKLLCEWNEFCQNTLHKNFPGIPIHADIANFNPFPYDGAFDIITAGVPCPPFSRQGQRLATADNRNRFDDFLRVITGCRPRWVIVENVPGLLDAPLKPGASRGSFFRNLLWQLSQVGYMGEWLVLGAAQFGLPQSTRAIVYHCLPPQH